MEKDNDALVHEGKRLCFDSDVHDVVKGRELLRKASDAGRDDATYFLGRSLEAEGLYDQAAEFYKLALDKRYRVAIYRLAILHGRGQLSYSDRGYYLKTIERLSRDGHNPSVARYTIERIRGSYGLTAILGGLVAIIPNFLRVAYTAYKDPNDPRLHR
jgi:TPR repeat protein